MPKKKVGDLEMVVHDRPGERGVENLLHIGLAPLQVPADPVIVGGKMIREFAQSGLARRVEPASHPCEVPISGCVWQIVRQRPDPQQHWKQMGMPIRERVYKGPGWRRHGTVQHSGVEIKKRRKEIFQSSRRPLDQPDLELHLCL
jgi:hypothetical protein